MLYTILTGCFFSHCFRWIGKERLKNFWWHRSHVMAAGGGIAWFVRRAVSSVVEAGNFGSWDL